MCTICIVMYMYTQLSAKTPIILVYIQYCIFWCSKKMKTEKILHYNIHKLINYICLSLKEGEICRPHMKIFCQLFWTGRHQYVLMEGFINWIFCYLDRTRRPLLVLCNLLILCYYMYIICDTEDIIFESHFSFKYFLDPSKFSWLHYRENVKFNWKDTSYLPVGYNKYNKKVLHVIYLSILPKRII
jgi:hypothetical protein